MFCTECGNSVPPRGLKCAVCGAATPLAAGASAAPPGHPQPAAYVSAHQYYPQSYGGDGLAIAGFILGLIGLLLSWSCFGLIFSVVGLILSGCGMRSQQRGLAVAGLVLSLVAIAITVTLVAIGVAIGLSQPHYTPVYMPRS